MPQYHHAAPLRVHIQPQPDDSSCGPTSLHAIYSFYNRDHSISEIRSGLSSLEDGGTFAVSLALDALRRGFATDLISYNLGIFDLTWKGLPNEALVEKLTLQAQVKSGERFHLATSQYIEYLKAGGKILFEDLTLELLDQYFDNGMPVLTGLSSTYLYGSMRERAASAEILVDDDIGGDPTGHFVVLCGRKKEEIYVADPYVKNPIKGDHYYGVNSAHLFHAILLGIVTYDANLLIIKPKSN